MNLAHFPDDSRHREDITIPIPMTETNHDPGGAIDQDRAKFCDGAISQITHFDFDDVDRALGLIESTPADARAEAAELVAQLMIWIWGSGAVKTALVRMTAMTAGLRPGLLQDKTYKALGQELGVSKQTLSKTALRFSAAFDTKLARSRSDIGRRHMAEAAMGNQNRAKHYATKPARGTAQPQKGEQDNA
jgi:hypothetical protein